jgi:hypothetical protein
MAIKFFLLSVQMAKISYDILLFSCFAVFRSQTTENFFLSCDLQKLKFFSYARNVAVWLLCRGKDFKEKV